jgi:hypothetical protein
MGSITNRVEWISPTRRIVFKPLSSENAPQIPLYPPLLKRDFIIPLFGKEGLGEIFIVPCDGVPL